MEGATPAGAAHAEPEPQSHTSPGVPVSKATLTAALKDAQTRDDLPGVVALCEQLRRDYPQSVLGYQAGANALRLSGRYDEASEILDQAAFRTRQTLWLRVERVWLAQQSGDWPQVALQASVLRERFPDEMAGWRLGCAAARHLGDLEGAEALLLQAPPRARSEAWFLEGLAQLAAQRGAWEAACERAAALRAAVPAYEHGYRIGLRSLRALKRFDAMATLLAEAEAALPGRIWLQIETAYLAQARGDWVQASELWRRLRQDADSLPDGYTGGVRAALALKRPEEAALVHREAATRFAGTAWLLAQAADLAHANGSLALAAQLWTTLRAAHPDALEGYHGGYRTYRALGRLKDAEAVLVEAVQRFPLDRWALAEYALVAKAAFDFEAAERRWEQAAAALPNDPDIALRHALARSQDVPLKRRDWPTTRARLQALNARFPNYALGWLEHVKTLRFMGERGAAEALAQACVRRMPDEPELWLEYARTTTDETGMVAAERLGEAGGRCPQHPGLQAALAEALAQAGRLDEADLQYRRALQQSEGSAALLCGYASIAMRQQRWWEALERWQAAQRFFPTDERVVLGLLDTCAAIEDGREAQALEALRLPGAAAASTTDRAAMFAQFESLGGTGQACEFGLVQRAAGAEPIGLLRWTHITPAALVEALTTRFDGMGTEAQTVIDYYRSEDPENPEYRYRDTRFGTHMHTFVHRREMGEAEMLRRTCRRIAFLQRKLIGDLEDAQKIFVYKIYERTMDASELGALHQALQIYGANSLLYVCYADPLHPSGTVELAGDSLMVGYISGFNVCRDTHAVRAPDLAAWNAICETAYGLHGKRSV